MPRLLGSVLSVVVLAAALGACGDEDSGTVAEDTSSTSSSSPSASSPSPSQAASSPVPSDGPVDFEVAGTVTQTAAGGTVSPAGVLLSADADVQAFVAPFSDPLQAAVQKAVQKADVPDGKELYGAVVAIGCDVPGEFTVTAEGSGLLITAQPVPNPTPECLAPMTTVALVLVPVRS